ncbi:hypothetical protein A2276_06840 [candidate division WOR-1 bacterium RIFOXYA12_FULL_43_27]|uniref:DEAD/DEAH box helicase n=1 Tax=candidate division WOR-1 bacterium RIFOXYC2_FULL_46_14 TaxID=1802587 RepID=A0A1F4U5R1_UNCSA|nr:MAG: hypothetical protein A2276_06840 [candidate division WOR-1 bacterium RIFOXYA12_FULL_43_27]OGC20363.1 MAG: hypothetical protein A2292_04840 [candidate division WOR-1 bacterium RIFOXYB2_FULL_46_45]OGC31900.1 MAG: hypothetical protein A2232_06610 [candidate division WOR-1 bacterium RIFOXYA2_FULL_46_56]OGC40209.1 MAG: hypothetical protein A2438_02860 [candidate division WOR-1 bacterium RIFOXYC2_FULL_46_14]
MDKNNSINQDFYGLGIAPKLIELLERIKFKTPTPIQYKAIPIAVEGKDIVGVAQTGTGKTLAFGVPMIQRLLNSQDKGLVLVPTRELALQVEEELMKIGRPLGIKTAVLIGGASKYLQVKALRMNPRIIIATPGRLNDHLQDGSIRLDRIMIVVLDEADRMLDMGFLPQIEKVLRNLPVNKQTMLFSATIPEAVVKIASRYMKLPVGVEIAKSGTAAKNILQELFIIKKEDKSRLLCKLLEQYRGTVLIFSRTKHGATRITNGLRGLGYTAAEIHANRSLSQRREALEGFKRGKYRILVATDIAARGIDVKEIELVVNYDLPDDAENYVHRIGRTGRAGHEGRAISLATPDQRGEVRNIEKIMQKALPVSRHPDFVPIDFETAMVRSFGPRGRSGRPIGRFRRRR